VATKTEIVNLALTFVGGGRVTDANSTTDPIARAFADVYDITVRAELEKHNWRFAIRRAAINRIDPSPPGVTEKHAYTLPADCARVVNVLERPSDDWEKIEREGKTILLDSGAVINVRYVSYDLPEGDWPGTFQRVIAAALADTRNMAQTKTTTMSEFQQKRYEREVRAAKRAQAIERRMDESPYSPTVYDRVSGSFGGWPGIISG
jgi:hypothetical protein